MASSRMWLGYQVIRVTKTMYQIIIGQMASLSLFAFKKQASFQDVIVLVSSY